MDAAEATIAPDYGRLLRRYGFMASLLVVLGGIGGFLSIALMVPKYQAKVLLEVDQQGALTKTIQDVLGGGAANLSTEARIAVSRQTLQRAVQRLEFESLPAEATNPDIFSRLRRLLGVADSEYVPAAFNVNFSDVEHAPGPLALALRTATANVITGTHLIEISCQSTDPQFAARFVNVVADEYIQQNFEKHADSARVSTQWISGQLKESKEKLLDSEHKLDDFNRNSGNLFAARDRTLAESKRKELQEKIAVAESELIPKKVRYETARRTQPDALPAILDDAGLNSYESRLAELRRQEASLLTTLQPAHPKVRKLESEISELQSDRRKQIRAAVEEIKSEYEQGQREVGLLKKQYAAATSQVAGQAEKQQRYAALERETESARTMYEGMMRSANEAGVAASAPLHVIEILDRGTPPEKPVSPNPPVNIGLGAVAGLALAFGIAQFIERKDSKLKSPRDASQYLAARPLGVIPSVTGAGIRQRLTNSFSGRRFAEPEILLPPLPDHDSARELEKPRVTESFRMTLASLMRGSEGLRGRSIILVTSPAPREGKTTVAGHLGVALAETGRRVLLVDADFRRPRAHLLFGVANRNGLADLLEGSAPVDDCPGTGLGVPTSVPNLWVLPNGRPSQNIAQQIYSSRLRELLDRLRQDFDFVLIDAPPVLPLADARILSGLTDGVVLVLRSGVTDRESAVEALECLQTNGAVILGTVLNDWRMSRVEARSYQYYSSLDDRE